MSKVLESKRNLVILIIGAVIISFVGAIVYYNYSLNNKANKELANVLSMKAPVSAWNDELLIFTTGQIIENTNIEQKALGRNGEVTTPARFIFSNGKGKNPKTVKAFLDFSEQRSRDFILINKDLLQGLIEGGVINLEVYSIPAGRGYSIFSTEALAEAFVSEPDKAWEYFIELMKLSAELESNVSADEMVERIAETAHKVKINQIDEDSIWNGSFTSWILTVGEDPFLQTGVLLPEVMVNNEAIADIININDTEALRRVITSE